MHSHTHTDSLRERRLIFQHGGTPGVPENVPHTESTEPTPEQRPENQEALTKAHQQRLAEAQHALRMVATALSQEMQHVRSWFHTMPPARQQSFIESSNVELLRRHQQVLGYPLAQVGIGIMENGHPGPVFVDPYTRQPLPPGMVFAPGAPGSVPAAAPQFAPAYQPQAGPGPTPGIVPEALEGPSLDVIARQELVDLRAAVVAELQAWQSGAVLPEFQEDIPSFIIQIEVMLSSIDRFLMRLRNPNDASAVLYGRQYAANGWGRLAMLQARRGIDASPRPPVVIPTAPPPAPQDVVPTALPSTPSAAPPDQPPAAPPTTPPETRPTPAAPEQEKPKPNSSQALGAFKWYLENAKGVPQYQKRINEHRKILDAEGSKDEAKSAARAEILKIIQEERTNRASITTVFGSVLKDQALEAQFTKRGTDLDKLEAQMKQPAAEQLKIPPKPVEEPKQPAQPTEREPFSGRTTTIDAFLDRDTCKLLRLDGPLKVAGLTPGMKVRVRGEIFGREEISDIREGDEPYWSIENNYGFSVERTEQSLIIKPYRPGVDIKITRIADALMVSLDLPEKEKPKEESSPKNIEREKAALEAATLATRLQKAYGRNGIRFTAEKNDIRLTRGTSAICRYRLCVGEDRYPMTPMPALQLNIWTQGERGLGTYRPLSSFTDAQRMIEEDLAQRNIARETA